MRLLPAIAVAALVVSGTTATPASALDHRPVATAGCHSPLDPGTPLPRGDRLGAFAWSGDWGGYATWHNIEQQRDPDGLIYAKNPMFVRRGTIASLSIAPAYRGQADFVYGDNRRGTARVLSDAVRVRACKRRATFYSGGLIVTGSTCVLIEARERGSRRVQRRMISINMGTSCPAP
jgi:hypothetical protein